MVDWKGFLKWSMNYTDGTTPTQISPLTQEQQEFLEEAMKSITLDEVKMMKEILQFLSENIHNENQMEKIEENFETLLDLLSNLDQAKNFAKIGGVDLFFEFSVDPKLNSKIRAWCLLILIDCIQNNDFVLKFFERFDQSKLLLILQQEDYMLQYRAIGLVSALLNGTNLKLKRSFLEVSEFHKVVAFLWRIVKKELNFNTQSQKDNMLVKTFNIFQQIFNSLRFLDKDVDYQENEAKYESYKEKQEYKVLVDYVKMNLKDLLQLITEIQEEILQDNDSQRHNLRVKYFSMLLDILQENKRLNILRKATYQNLLQKIKEYKKQVKKQKHKNEELWEQEKSLIKQVLKHG